MNVSAILVTRGDVDMRPVLESLPAEWEKIVYDNGVPQVRVYPPGLDWRKQRDWMEPLRGVLDLSVYGRYAAIEHAAHEIIFTQDDDCIVSDPRAIVRQFISGESYDITQREEGSFKESLARTDYDYVVCNMPQQYRHSFYVDHSLVGFGACFHRDAPARAFQRMTDVVPTLGLSNYGWWLPGFPGNDHFNNTCDVAFTALTPRVLVDVPKTDREFASDPGRMWTTEGHQEERSRMLDLVRRVRERKVA